MAEPIVLRFVGAPVYEGRPGWPAKDMTQEELDARGLSKAELLAYRPMLYQEVKPEVKSVKPIKPKRKKVKRVKKSEPGSPEALVLNAKRQEEIEHSELGKPETLVYRPGLGEADKPELAGSET